MWWDAFLELVDFLDRRFAITAHMDWASGIENNVDDSPELRAEDGLDLGI